MYSPCRDVQVVAGSHRRSLLLATLLVRKCWLPDLRPPRFLQSVAAWQRIQRKLPAASVIRPIARIGTRWSPQPPQLLRHMRAGWPLGRCGSWRTAHESAPGCPRQVTHHAWPCATYALVRATSCPRSCAVFSMSMVSRF